MSSDKHNDHKMSEHMKKCVKYTKSDIICELILILEKNDVGYELLEENSGIRCNNTSKQSLKDMVKENSNIDYSIIKTFCNIMKINNGAIIVFSDLSN